MEKNTRPWENFPVITREKVRWRDLDSYGHITNSVYFNYFEQGRIAYFGQIPELLKVLEKKEGASPYVTVLVKTSADFKNQGYLNDKLVICTKAIKAKRGVLQTYYEIYNEDNGLLLAKGDAVNLLIHAESLRPASLPEDVLERIRNIENSRVEV